MSASPRPERYYPTLAQTGTQQAIDCLVENFAGRLCLIFIDVFATVFPPYFANGAPMSVKSSRDSSSVFAVVTKQMSMPRTLSILS